MKTAIAIAVAAAVSLIAGEIYAEEGGKEDGTAYDCSKAPRYAILSLDMLRLRHLSPECEILLSIKDPSQSLGT